MYTDKFPILGNFIETKLTESCIESDTTLYVADTSNLPDVLTGKDYIPCVLRDAGMDREIVYVTAFDTATNSLTVERGKEGTTPAAWNSGTYFYNTLTAASLQSMRVNSFSPLVDADAGRPVITRTSATTITIPGDWTDKLEVGMAVRVISGDAVVMPVDMELGAIHISSKYFADDVTTVALQNVNLPAEVSGLDLGLSVAAAPMYHPDTYVADEETLTHEQNVLRVSDAFRDRLESIKPDTLLAAEKAADVSGGSLGDADLNNILSAYELTQAELATVRAMFKVGAVMAFAANSEPEGYLLCNGAAVSRTTYAALFAAIGTTYGKGNGSSTFNLPNLNNRFIQGSGTAGTVKAAGLPNITGRVSDEAYWQRLGAIYSGAFHNDGDTDGGYPHTYGGHDTSGSSVIALDASRSNPIYGNSDTVQPPAVTMRYYIKY